MDLYWLLTISHIHSLFDFLGSILTIFSSGIFFVSTIFYLSSDDGNEYKRSIKALKLSSYGLFGSILLLLTLCLIPTRTDIAIMLGYDAMKSDSVKEVIATLKKKLE